MRKNVLSEKRRKLISESESKSRYSDFCNFLNMHPSFMDDDWDSAPNDIKLFKSYFPSIVEELIEICVLEWRYTGNIQGVKVNDDGSKCGLCGYSRCLTLYPISNSLNQKTLYIGSECVKEFGFTGKEQVFLISARQDTLIAYTDLIKVRPRVLPNSY